MRAKIAGRLQEPARQWCAGEHFRLLLSASRIFFCLGYNYPTSSKT
jgi:hypothetical protein